ncbi:hypothetical protein LZ519_04720 [Sphingomonas sp. RG327]|jgi:hypothetical protein|uniref:Uncharacterized protein n=1 Tax=Sphingomonas anseongensis TaxID=2908207 RepID=A0ABT0REF5_9SPHN|nr:hypothetical protein [Sphingomonas anseongensis]MCL6678621.1 hypothetical protein [Sphingomonas anseongensis]
MLESDHVYFARRASEERTAAICTPNDEARKAHIELAERYEDLVRAIVGRQQLLGVESALLRPAFDEFG